MRFELYLSATLVLMAAAKAQINSTSPVPEQTPAVKQYIGETAFEVSAIDTIKRDFVAGRRSEYCPKELVEAVPDCLKYFLKRRFSQKHFSSLEITLLTGVISETLSNTYAKNKNQIKTSATNDSSHNFQGADRGLTLLELLGLMDEMAIQTRPPTTPGALKTENDRKQWSQVLEVDRGVTVKFRQHFHEKIAGMLPAVKKVIDGLQPSPEKKQFGKRYAAIETIIKDAAPTFTDRKAASADKAEKRHN